LLDEVLPRWDFGEVHHTDLAVERAAAYGALLELEVQDIVLTRALLELRELPARIRGTRPAIGDRLVDTLEGAGFRRLAEAPGEEIVWGIVGRFWHPWHNVEPEQPADLDAFTRYAEPQRAKAAWSFRFEPLPGAGTRATTETRIQGTDAAARRRFRLYWLVIRPGSGVIRHDLLRALRRRALGAGRGAA
jgi:hypothetical protein